MKPREKSPGVAAIITAAGNASRMGVPKAGLKHKSGHSFAKFLLTSYLEFGCGPVILIVNPAFNPTEFETGMQKVIVNEHPEQGRSHSIHLGISQVPAGFACFIHNVDNPYLEPGLFSGLMENLQPASYTVPVFNGRGGHPVLLGSLVVAALAKLGKIENFRLALKDFPRNEFLHHDERILLNINTPEDYQIYLKNHQ